MSTFTKTSVIVAVLGIAAFVLHTSDVDTVSILETDYAVSGAPVKATSDSQRGLANSASRDAFSMSAPDDTTVTDSYETPSYSSVAVAQASAPGARSATADTAAEDDRDSEPVAATAKMSDAVVALAMAGGPGLADLVVSYSDHPELFEDGRIEELGGEVVRHYEVLDLLAIRIPAESLIDFAVDEDVQRVSLDEPVFAGSTSLSDSVAAPTLVSTNVSYKGHNQTIAVLDSGVGYHGDLSGNIHQLSFLNGAMPRPDIEDGEVDFDDDDDRSDAFGHGTHISGIVSGTGANSNGLYQGLATQANIISLQVLDQDGHGQVSDVIGALDWMLKYGPYLDISVANLSLGKPVTESNTKDPLVRAVNRLWDSGVVVVVAAGNYGREGYFSITSPGNSRKVITVGSLTDNGTGADFDDNYVSTYSSRGPSAEDHVVKPDLVAPGNRIVAAIPSGANLKTLLPGNVVSCTVSNTCNSHYLEMSGTSMSTGSVSAAVAMMLQKDPTLSPATIKARLMRSARKIGESPIDAGAGLLDVDAALNDTGVVSGQALSPLMAFDPQTGGTLIQDTATLWGGDLWGSGYLWTDGGVNANGYLWTDGGVNANGYLWTDGGVFANGYLWTDGGVAAFGYLWTDGVNANGYLWTDVGVDNNGYLWTDGVNANGYLWTDEGFQAPALRDFNSENPSLNDDDHTSE